jgi:hypothetical protein
LDKTMSDKEASQVLTSENAAEFYANKLGLADQNEPEAVETEPVQAEEQSEPAQDEAKPTEEKKPNPKLERRFSELTKQREQAKLEAETERARAAQLEARLRALEQQAAPKQSVDTEPQPGQFQDAFEYAKALAEYSTEKALNERDQREAQARANAERQKVIESWTQKLDKVKAELPDYDEMVSTANVVVSDEIRDAILESDVGPRILYDLAENLEFAQKLAQMPTTKALREIGKLEAKYDKVEAPKETVVKSKAPAPIRPLKANGAADIPINSNGEFHGTYQAWKEARKAGKIR